MFSSFQLQTEIANLFMQNQVDKAIHYCYQLIKKQLQQAQTVDEAFFLLLFDLLKVKGDQAIYDEFSAKYQELTQKAPPDWENKNFNQMISHNNLLTLKGAITEKTHPAMNQFIQACHKTQFGRLDLNHLDLAQSDSKGVKVLLNGLNELKMLTHMEIHLMGEQTVLNYRERKQDTPIHRATHADDEATMEFLYQQELTKYNLEMEKIKEQQAQREQLLLPLKQEIQQLANQLNQPNKSLSVKSRENIEHQLKIKQEDLRIAQQKQKPLTPPKQPKKEDFFWYRTTQKQKSAPNEPNPPVSTDDPQQKAEFIVQLQLEILQWIGARQAYEQLAQSYSEQYKRFAPDYQVKLESKNRMVKRHQVSPFEISNHFNSLDQNNAVITSKVSEITSQNLPQLLAFLQHTTDPIVRINLYQTNFFTYEACLALMAFMVDNQHKDIQLAIKYANMGIQILFKNVGLDHFVKFV